MSLFQAPVSIDGTLARAQRKSFEQEVGSLKASVTHHEQATKPVEHISNGIYDRSLPSLHFLRWRPMYHLLAANAWMNDPCAPGYDPTTGLYHLSFQWNPRRNVYGKIAWGTIAWGHATSKDLISWTVSGAPSIEPGKWYDKEGCFTGCMYPTGVDGSKGRLTIFYTGVSRLPLHFSLPYVKKTETLNMAHSNDGGSTWIKDDSNPIIPEPPIDLTVTGWRDPMVAPWPSLDTALGKSIGEGNLYGLISGGIKDRGPTAFLYTIDKRNLAQWTFVSDLVELGINHNISRWSGDMGVNWECTNFTTLVDSEDGAYRELIIVGGEGSKTSPTEYSFTQHPQQQTQFPRAERSQQWMCGTFVNEQGLDGNFVPKLKYTMGGRFDHGIGYGYNSFTDPLTSRQIVWGWITEEDLPQKLVDRQNWSGLISLPREVRMQTLRGVKKALVSQLSDITSIEAQPDAKNEGTYTVRTLAIIPANHVESLRRSSREVNVPEGRKLQSFEKKDDVLRLDVQSCRFEVFSVFTVSNTCQRIGLSIFHTQDRNFAGSTTISLITTSETLRIDRPDSNHVDPDISTLPETAPFTLFESADGTREQLEIRAWFDESVLEVFVNERCVFSTRVYPATKRCWGIGFWAEDEECASTLVGARAWDGLRADIRVNS
jgi:beta-fructofuranosidase